MWWFIVHGQESVLSALDTEWENVQLQTKRSLERCFMPSSANGNAAPLLQHNMSGNTTNPSVNDKSDAQESSTGPIQHAMQNTSGPVSIQPILATPTSSPVNTSHSPELVSNEQQSPISSNLSTKTQSPTQSMAPNENTNCDSVPAPNSSPFLEQDTLVTT